MLKQMLTVFCCAIFALATAQVDDPFLTDKTGSPAQVRPSPSIRYQNTRPRQTPRFAPRTTPFPVTQPNTSGTYLNPRGNEEPVSPMRYNAPAPAEQSWIDTVRIFHFDADGKRYRDPSQVYRDLNLRPAQRQDNESREDTYRRDEEADTNIAPWDRSDDTRSSGDQ